MAEPNAVTSISGPPCSVSAGYVVAATVPALVVICVNASGAVERILMVSVNSSMAISLPETKLLNSSVAPVFCLNMPVVDELPLDNEIRIQSDFDLSGHKIPLCC